MATKKKQDDKRKYLDGDLTKVKALENGAFEGIVATNAVDRHGEVVNIEGIDTKTYLTKNPIVLFGHDYWEAESIIGRAISLTKTKTGQLLSNFELFVDDNPKALLVSKLIKKGVCSLSIGFVPKEMDGDEYTKSEMVEFSVVPVPANGEAAITARSLGLTKKDMGAIRKAFADSPMITIKDDSVQVKGAVADEIAEEEKWEKKWANMREFWDIVYAFCDVYYDEDTEVDDFGKLLGETLSLLGDLSPAAASDSENENDTENETEYASAVAAALKNMDEKELTAFADSMQEVQKLKGLKSVSEKIVDNKATKGMDDGDVNAIQNLAQLITEAYDKMGQVHASAQQMAAVKDAGGDDTEAEMEVPDAAGNDTGTMKPTNTVKAPEEVVEDEAEVDEVVETKHKEIAVGDLKVDITDVKADNLMQLATALKAAAVELEEDASSLASSTTAGGTSPTTRKRKYVLRSAKKKVVTVDKMVELTLRQLNIK